MKRALWLILIVGCVAAVGAAAWFWQTYQTYLRTPLAMAPDGQILTIAPGISVARLAGQLEDSGLISADWLFRLQARLSGKSHQIKAGEYLLEAGSTPVDLLALVVAGRTHQHSLALIEGWTFREFRSAIGAHPALLHDTEGLGDSEIMQRLGQADRHPEGLFFPSTYHFPRGFSELELLRRAFGEMEAILTSAWEQRDPDLPVKTPYEALILASVVEKETGVAAERPQIAGVFTRRLRKGMLLQSDPTIIYGLGEAFDGNLRRRDLQNDTPYNSYTRAGLPPTPICMPGSEAIHAVLHPAEGDSLYFVAKGDGSHQFSATLEQHNAAVRRYQLKKSR